jgi:uncharacterized protein
VLLKRFFQSEAGATVLWVLSSLVIAACIAPSLYGWGKTLAAEAVARELSAFLEWLGHACRRAEFNRYYSRALALSAILLLPFLFRRIRHLRVTHGATVMNQVKTGWKNASLQIGLGILIAGGLLWGVGLVLESMGVYQPDPDPPALAKLLRKTLVPAVSVSLLEEWLFRGVLLGLWLKCARPVAACVGSSLFFALIHFLKLPEGEVISNPAGMWAGFELLGKIFLHFGDPQFLVTDFATLFVVGMILAWARVKTGALWFSIGLHAGWIIAFKGFNLLHIRVSSDSIGSWGVGETLRSGIIPLMTLGLTAAVCHFTLRYFKEAPPVVNRASQ